jgi:serine/threonine-protein kinase RsbW
MSWDERNEPENVRPREGKGSPSFRITMASDPRLLAVVRSTVSALASLWGFDEKQGLRITLAVDEALSNVIRHAYGGRCDGQIELHFEAYADCVEFTFVDRGAPAELSKICAQPLNETALGGRGTHLIREIMDEVRYERVSEANRWSLKKYLPGSRGEAGETVKQS